MDKPMDFVTIVSGLPRSGTSMMMRILEAGGIAPVQDKQRTANEDNPRGYYEYERVKALPTDKSWVPDARGSAVKIIYKLVYELPQGIPYRVLFMQREIAEVVRSQEKMLEREGLDPGRDQRDIIADLFQSEIMAFRNWVAAQPDMKMHVVDYASVIASPEEQMAQISAFLGGGLDIAAMTAVVEPDLYRNRA
ncbi:sulfotransferase family protein [Sulfitobacter sp. JB4-11]|uniref:sulfotransferase family protein n=1 Tax=Sulfitobacter rhodophyticola TaxID=3238304 RepID=UPI00351727C1